MKKLECECGRVLGYEPRHAGKKVKCSGCGKALTVPDDKDAPLALVPADEPEPEPRPRPKPRRRMQEDADDVRPGEPTKGVLERIANYTGKNQSVPLILVFGAILIPVAIYQGSIASWSSGPQRIRLVDLAEKGPGGNLHVIVTDARPGAAAVLVRTSKNHNTGKTSTENLRYYTPLLPASGSGGEFRVILVTEADEGRKAPPGLGPGEYQGTIVNSISSLDQKAQDFLKQQYPATDFSKVYIVDEGRVPWSRGLVILTLLAGIVTTGIALSMWGIMLACRTEFTAE